MLLCSLIFLSAAIFSLQSLLSPVVSTILAGNAIELVITAPAFGVAMGALLTSLTARTNHVRALALTAFLISIPACLFTLHHIQLRLDQAVVHALTPESNVFLAAVQGSIAPAFHLPLMLALALPFLCYTVFVVLLFSQAPAGRVPLFLAGEMLGAGMGWSGGLVVLERWGFGASLSLAQTLATLGIFLWLMSARRLLPRRFHVLSLAVAVVTTTLTVIFWRNLEPKRDLHLAAFDLHFRESIVELNQSWTPYAKVQKLEIRGENKTYRKIFIGEGGGQAGLIRYEPKIPVPKILTTEIARVFHPSKALILFAGAGRELIVLYDQGVRDLTGVELNPEVLRLALSDDQARLPEFLRDSSARLLAGDARVFLETTGEAYDIILYSWSGASVGHYSGAVLHTTQYAFTVEALRKAYQKLAADGVIVIVGGPNKLSLLANLRVSLPEVKLEDSIALLTPQGEETFSSSWDEQALILKKGHLSEGEVTNLSRVARENNHYLRFPLASDSVAQKVSILEQDPHFTPHTDDKPFVYAIAPALTLASVLDWPPGPSGVAIWIGVLALGWIGSSLLRVRAGTALFFACIGFYAMALPALAAYKFILYFQNPAHAIMITTGGMLLAAALGGILSSWLTPRSNLRWMGIGIFLSLLWSLSWGFPGVKAFYFGLADVPRTLALSLPILTLGTLASALYGYALRRQASLGSRNVSRALALDATGALLALLWIPLLVEQIGYSHCALWVSLTLASAFAAQTTAN